MGGRRKAYPRISRFTFALVSHFKNCVTCFQLEHSGPYNHHALAFWQLLTHIFGGQIVVSVGQGARNCWLNSFCSLWLRGNSGQWLDSFPVLREHDTVGLGRGTISPCHRTAFWIPVECSEELRSRTRPESNLHVCIVSVDVAQWRFTGCISGLVFFNTAFWITKSELIRATDSSKWNENRSSFCLRRGGFCNLFFFFF